MLRTVLRTDLLVIGAKNRYQNIYMYGLVWLKKGMARGELNVVHTLSISLRATNDDHWHKAKQCFVHLCQTTTYQGCT